MSSRHPLRGEPSNSIGPPHRLYPVANVQPVMIARPRALTQPPVMTFVPYNPAAVIPSHPHQMVIPQYCPNTAERSMPVQSVSMVTAAPMDLRNQTAPIEKCAKKMSPRPVPASIQSDQPLDLSIRCKQRNSPKQVLKCYKHHTDLHHVNWRNVFVNKDLW